MRIVKFQTNRPGKLVFICRTSYIRSVLGLIWPFRQEKRMKIRSNMTLAGAGLFGLIARRRK